MALRNSLLNRSTRSIIEPLEERQLLSLTITNPDAVLGSDNRLFFNTIQNVNSKYPSEANNVHKSQPLILTNSGSTPLILQPIGVSGPFSVTGGPAAGQTATIAAGASLTLTVTFTQSTVPAHSGNETNFNQNPDGGASITGSLTITTNDPTTPTTTWALAGYFQTNSEDNEEPDLSTIVNTLAGYDTTLSTAAQQQAETPFTDDFVNGATTPTYYGQEVVSAAWVPANTAQPVGITYLANFRTIGNTVNTFWYTSSGTNAPGGSHLLFSTQAAQGQSVLPSATQGGTPIAASFYPDGNFGFRVDNEYSYDAINTNLGNTGGGGHHFRFYPLINSEGQAVPNAWIVAMDYAVIQSENFDFQDNVFIVTNMKPTGAPAAPTGLAATSVTNPVLSWNAVNFTAGALDGYNVYRSTTPNGPFTLLTSSPVTATTYTDSTSVPAGVSLYYQVTAVAAPNPATPGAPTESAPATATANTPAGPSAGSFSLTAASGQALAINVLPYDTDTSGNILPSSVTPTISGTAHGTLSSVDSNGNFTYTPAANFTGTQTIDYTIRDSNNATASGVITVTVVAAPSTTALANSDSALTLANAAVTINVLANDTPSTGATFNLSTLHVSTAANNGTAAVATDGSGNIIYTPGDGFVGNDSFVYTVTDTNGNAVHATVSLNVGVQLNPQGGKTAVRAVKYTDSSGSPVTVTLNRGVADIYFAGTGSDQAAAVHGVLTLTGSLTNADTELSGTSAASTLSITSPAKSHTISLGDINDASAVGVILARTSNFIGNINLYGGVHELLLGAAGDANSGTPYEINLGPNGVVTPVGAVFNNDIVIVSGLVQNTNLTSTVALNVVEAKGWIDSATDVSTVISGTTLNTLYITGPMQAGITLSGAAPFDLGTARITGAVTNGFWTVATGARTVSLSSVTAGFGGAAFSGTLNTLAVTGLPSDISAATINTLSVRGNLTGDITAATARTIAVTGQISGADLTFTGAGTDLRTLSAPGGIVNSTINSAANIGTLSAGLLTGDTITAGITTTGVTLGNVTLATLGNGTISNIRVAGRNATFNDTTIIAHTITGALGPINSNNNGTPQGVALNTTHSLTATENGTIVRLTPKTTSSPPNFGDFEIELVTA